MYLVIARYTQDDAPLALYEKEKEAELFAEFITEDQVHEVAERIMDTDITQENLCSLVIVQFVGPKPWPARLVRTFGGE